MPHPQPSRTLSWCELPLSSAYSSREPPSFCPRTLGPLTLDHLFSYTIHSRQRSLHLHTRWGPTADDHPAFIFLPSTHISLSNPNPLRHTTNSSVSACSDLNLSSHPHILQHSWQPCSPQSPNQKPDSAPHRPAVQSFNPVRNGELFSPPKVSNWSWPTHLQAPYWMKSPLPHAGTQSPLWNPHPPPPLVALMSWPLS